jgi:predicted nucleic acid-binding protein
VAEFGLRPSDALHAATIRKYGLDAIASEDRDFDEAGIKRIWL